MSTRRTIAAAAPWALLLLGLGSLAPAALAVDVVVDGDLADLDAASQSIALDAAHDVAPAFRSGWDFTRVIVRYAAKVDRLFVGIDLLDGDEPGVPGDADGDRDPNGRSEPSVPFDQFGVGPDEAYQIRIDVDSDGDFESAEDLRVLYRGNSLVLLRGDGSAPPPGITAEIALGTAGASADPAMANQNRSTEDVEIAIHDYSLADASPCSFRMDAFAGSIVDTLPEDQLDSPLEIALPEPVVFSSAIGPAGGPYSRCVFASLGDVLTMSATVENAGPAPLDPVWIVHFLPPGIEYVADSAANAVAGRIVPRWGGTVVRHLRPDGLRALAPGSAATITFRVRVTSFAEDRPAIRGYAEGVAEDGPLRVCRFSCIDSVCVRRLN